MLEKATELDPQFSLAFSHLARNHVIAYVNRWGEDPDRSLDLAMELAEHAVALDDYKSRIERIVHFDLVAFDWNCPQHIKRRYTAEEFAALAEAANVSGPIAAPIPPEH